MKKMMWIVIVALSCLQAFADKPEQDARHAIVKIYTSYTSPDYYTPWNIDGPSRRTGSGCVISGKRILTNAHVVSNETFIQVRRSGDAKKYRARVLFVSHLVDLALLSVDDDNFFEGVQALAFDGLPETQSEVTVLGFPSGGDMLSTTKGVISRVEHRNYAHSAYSFLAAQLDAAINPGNSGGPVMKDGKIVGVVMQSLTSADNIGYMVPAPVVKHFLDDVKDGRFDAIPGLGVVAGSLENPDMKRKYGLAEEVSGIVVRYISPDSASDGVLNVGDIILSCDGFDVADDGTIEFRTDERTTFNYPAQLKQIGESLNLVIFRDGKKKTVELILSRPVTHGKLVKRDQYDIRPTYYIFGGAVLSPLTKDYLMAWGAGWYKKAPKKLIYNYSYCQPETAGDEVVILVRVIADDVNKGYHSTASWIVEFVNGQKIHNLKDLIQIVESSDDEFIVFSDSSNTELVYDRKKAQDAAAGILSRYRIPSDRSDDLK